MPSDPSILNASLKDLFQQQLHAVLATADAAGPYASLVAFAASSDLRQLVFVTGRNTRKFKNLLATGAAALLIDNRANTSTDLTGALAVTVLGTARESVGEERARLRAFLLLRHPGLADFVGAADTVVVAVTVERYLLVDQFQRVQVLAAADLS